MNYNLKIFFRPDAYGYYVKYIDSVFNLMDQENNLNEQNVNGDTSDNIIKTIDNQIILPDSSIESCIAFIERSQQQIKVPHKLRGPHLAMILLCKKLVEKGYNPSKYLGTYNIIPYFQIVPYFFIMSFYFFHYFFLFSP